MATIRIERLSKSFRADTRVLSDIDLEVGDGELMVVVGPSGCGKSTLLRIIAGLDQPTDGRVYIAGRDVTFVQPAARDVAMVFQSYALYPHLSVRDNLGFALRMRGLGRPEIARRVQAVAARLDIAGLLDGRPASLSGGERQRVALGRAIVREPAAFLLDEPLSNLDAALRVRTRAELARLHAELSATMLYVTHDQEEAMMLGDRICVLREGRIQQVGTPHEVYTQPANRFVGCFVGSPAMNIVRCRIEPAGRGVRLSSNAFTLILELAGLPSRDSMEVDLGVRPHDVERVEPGAGDTDCHVELVEPRGPDVIVTLRPTGGGELTAVFEGPGARVAQGETVGIRLRREALHLFLPDRGQRLP